MRAFGLGGVLATILLTVIPGRRSIVKAQSIAALPTCAQPAVLAAVQASGCALTDKKCFCSLAAPNLTSSVQEACSDADRAALAAFASTYCGGPAGGALTSSPSAADEAPSSTSATSGSPATTLPPATTSESDSVSISSSTVTTTAGNMTMNMTSSSSMSSPTMTTNATSSIDWPTNVPGNAAAETGLAVAALAVAAGAMGWILEEL